MVIKERWVLVNHGGQERKDEREKRIRKEKERTRGRRGRDTRT